MPTEYRPINNSRQTNFNEVTLFSSILEAY
ncbi:Uncharacterised protein [Serratia proteamaculans]|nr:Uncharacterised protein [Serratia proteamaculans]CAI1588917.1 Uncharacterised protein [Serratia proteamaculans]CAI1621928.1 Uncharacterised protein [Serratia proteamaculans]CAI2483568.1 Uncharacterised protein [Serratia proteamaculans]